MKQPCFSRSLSVSLMHTHMHTCLLYSFKVDLYNVTVLKLQLQTETHCAWGHANIPNGSNKKKQKNTDFIMYIYIDSCVSSHLIGLTVSVCKGLYKNLFSLKIHLSLSLFFLAENWER